MGLHPIPCAPRSKRPIVEWRRYQETPPLADELDEWWSRTPDANVALVLGRGTFAVDLDGGHEAEKLLADVGVYLPGAPRSKTAHGYHVFLSAPIQVPDRVALLSTRGKKPQVDIRGVGIVVAPPSIHPDGPTYEWYIPLALPFPPAPQALLDLILKGGQATAPLIGPRDHWVAEALAGVGEGLRDQTCTRLAGFFLHAGLDPVTVEAVLAESFARNCTPPFPLEDLRKCVRSIARRQVAAAPEDPAIRPIHISEALDGFKAELTQGKGVAVATPFGSLNAMLSGGFYPGELAYIGARAGIGKTALGLVVARKAAGPARSVLFISREMLNIALARRMVAQESNVPASQLRVGRLEGPDDRSAVEQAMVRLRDKPIWLTDQVVSISEITGMIQRWSTTPALGLLIVDYLQLVRAPRDIRERRLQVEAVSQALKTLALEHKMPVLCLSSLARAVQGDSKRPTLASLRESGELEHDADIVLLLHRDPMEPETECIVAKNRDGRLGVAHLMFNSLTVNFTEASDRREDR